MLKEIGRLFLDLFWPILILIVAACGQFQGHLSEWNWIFLFIIAMGLSDVVHKNRKLEKDVRDLKEKVLDIKSQR